MKHDHLLELRGVWEGIPEFELHCDHSLDDRRFFIDNEGTEWETCILQSWWDELGTEIIHSTGDPRHDEDYKRWGPKHSIKLWTHWLEFQGEAVLDGYHEHVRRLEEQE